MKSKVRSEVVRYDVKLREHHGINPSLRQGSWTGLVRDRHMRGSFERYGVITRCSEASEASCHGILLTPRKFPKRQHPWRYYPIECTILSCPDTWQWQRDSC